jgi:hypothetical protein
MKVRSLGAVVALFSIAWLMAAPAYAYVDPGTGGMLIQLLPAARLDRRSGPSVLGRIKRLGTTSGVRRRGSTAPARESCSTNDRFRPASFKDPAGRVFHHNNWVCRTLSAEAAAPSARPPA